MVAAAAVTYFATPFVREFAVRWGAMAEVRDRDVHALPTPRLGGLAIYAGLLAAVVAASQMRLMGQVFEGSTSAVWYLLAAATVLVLVGMADDRWGMDPLTKFCGQVLAGGIIAYGGISISWVPIGGVFVLDPLTSVLLTVFIVVLTVNAINFVDGLDGLAAGIAGIAAAGFFAYSYLLSVSLGFDRATLSTLASASLVGACLGFLPHNFFRARIFMGDTGSMLLGLILATSTITLVGRVDPNAVGSTMLAPALLPLLLPLAVLALPVLDLGMAVVRRTWAGRSPFAPDKAHLHHRIMEMGHSHRGAVLLMYSWAVTFAGIVVAFSFLPMWMAILFGLALLAIVTAALRSPPGRRLAEDQPSQPASRVSERGDEEQPATAALRSDSDPRGDEGPAESVVGGERDTRTGAGAGLDVRSDQAVPPGPTGQPSFERS
jgi:UDP-GlcNAc:undecaprenyl-phosphate GlcNAc-1-phosphate transferase